MNTGRSADEQRALDLIASAYDAALEPKHWPQVVRDIVAFVGGRKGLLFTPTAPPNQGGFAFPFELPGNFVQQWEARYVHHDLWTLASFAKGFFREGTVVLDKYVVSEAEFFNSIVYREFLGPLGVARLCAGVVFDDQSPHALPTVCSVYRDRPDEPFGEAEAGLMRILVPHLSRALGVTYRLRTAELKIAANLHALDRLDSAIVLLDRHAHVAFANREAHAVFQEDDGLGLRRYAPKDVLGRIAVSDSPTQEALDAVIAQCLSQDRLQAEHFSRGLRIGRPSGRRDYVLQLAPLVDSNPFCVDGNAVSAIVFINDPERALRLDEALLKRLYALTAAEVRLARRLGAGEDVPTAAAACGISVSTAKTQLAAIFFKTGTHRQADLVRLLLSLGSVRA